MKKIKLELDALNVQSYETTPAGTGAVKGLQAIEITGVQKTACSIECSYCITCQHCDASVMGTCPGQFGCGYDSDFTCDTCSTEWESCRG